MCEKRCVHSLDFPVLCLAYDNWELDVCASALFVKLLLLSGFHFFSLHKRSLFLTLVEFQHPSTESAASPEVCCRSRVMVDIQFFYSSQQPVTCVSKLPPPSLSPLLTASLLNVTVCIPETLQLCLTRSSGDEKGACLFSSPNSSQTGREEWICMGVTDPGSFLSCIPRLCDTAVV